MTLRPGPPRAPVSSCDSEPYPCCHFMHGALEALSSLDLAAGDVVLSVPGASEAMRQLSGSRADGTDALV